MIRYCGSAAATVKVDPAPGRSLENNMPAANGQPACHEPSKAA
jgi:hypothetical protein